MGDQVKSKSAQYRKKLKEENPLKYSEYLEKQRERAKKNRENLKKELKKKKPSDEAKKQKHRQLEQQRQRQTQYIERKKSENVNWKPKKKEKVTDTQTRNAIKSRQQYNRDKKRLERSNMSYQKMMWIRKKDREKKAAKRKQKREDADSKINKKGKLMQDQHGNAFSSKQTEWNVTTKIRTALPNTPVKFAKIVKNLVENATPMKRRSMEKIGIKSGKIRLNGIPTDIKASSEGKSALKTIAKSLVHESKRFLSKQLALNRRTITRVISKMGKQKGTTVGKEGIQNFYKREDIARILPQKRFATKDGPGYGMQISVKAAHSKYLAENHAKPVSLGKFAALRPKNVRKLAASHREYCACVYCVNIRYKLLVLSRTVKDSSKKKTCEKDILDILLCNKSDNEHFHKCQCINGECSICNNYNRKLQLFYNEIPENKVMKWSRWEKSTDSVTKKVKRIIVTKSGNKGTLLKEMVEEDIMKPAQGTTFIKHLHNAQWQNKQFSTLKNTLPPNWTLQIMDFAKNRGVIYQNEIKSAFFSPEQITMHPIVTYYQSEVGLVRDSAIIISEDCIHDYHAVRHFTAIVDRHIEGKTGNVPTRKVIFSDGCSSQYKSKGPFADLSLENSVEINRNFFGSEHGKSDSDAETGVVNRAVDRAIIGNQVIINNSKDMFNYCKTNLELNENLGKRSFFFVKNGDINRNRPETEVKPVPNTRKIHQVLNIKDERYTLQSRTLSCFCQYCRQKDYQNCLNREYVSEFTLQTLTCLKKNEEKNIAKPKPLSASSGNLEKKKKVPQKMKNEMKDNKTTKQPLKKPTGNMKKKDGVQKKDILQKKQNPLKTNNSDIKTQCDNTEIKTTGKVQNNVREHISDRDALFIQLQYKLINCSSFDEFQAECLNSLTLIEGFEVNVNHHISILNLRCGIDKAALQLLGEEFLAVNMYPIEVYGDGNCLPRCGAVFTGLHHIELRVRIAIEGIAFEHLYMDNKFLNKGSRHISGKNHTSLYAQYSDEFDPSAVLTPAIERRVYRKELMEIIKPGRYMGIWQMFCLASVLKSKVRSVYPLYGSGMVREDLNRIIFPRDIGVSLENEICIMWSHIHGCNIDRNLWRPNHFVVILPMDNSTQEIDVVMDSESESEENWNVGVSEILDHLEDIEGKPLLDISLEFSALDTFLQTADKREEEQVILDELIVDKAPSTPCSRAGRHHENTEESNIVTENNVQDVPTRFLNGHGYIITNTIKKENGWMDRHCILLLPRMFSELWTRLILKWKAVTCSTYSVVMFSRMGLRRSWTNYRNYEENKFLSMIFVIMILLNWIQCKLCRSCSEKKIRIYVLLAKNLRLLDIYFSYQ
ncbi:uncharacterized protein LOC127722119 [Mytilus californianus]|uniref:uncharacterized protein LOC127722119 n=1 Tax=Mytilus californianus TaxID=6549 RepID=UPI0022484E79|nr:uncharacterized protein LOC127722119 [Mytilus californianus]